jgi:hypothetical protein
VEGLFLILGDLVACVIGPLIGAALTLLLEVAALLFHAAVLGVMALLRRRARRAQATRPSMAAAPTPPSRPRGPWPRRLLIAALSLTVLLGLALAVADLCFAERILGWGIARWSRRTGVEVSYAGSRCELVTGTARLDGVHLRSPPGAANAFDLALDRVEVDLGVLALLRGEIGVERVALAGLRGTVDADLDAPRAAAGRRELTIGSFVLDDVRVDFTLHRHGRSLAGPLVIEHLEAAPLRRRWMLFDVLFRSQARGSVWGAPFEIASHPADAGRTTRWRATGLPVDLLAAYAGVPCAWLTDGAVDVDVDDRWSIDPPKYIHMDYQLHGHGLTVVPAEELSGVSAKMDRALAAYLAAKGGELAFAFSLDIDPDRFDGAASLDAVGLWEILAPAVAAGVAKELGWSPEEVERSRRLLTGAAKAMLDHWRKR